MLNVRASDASEAQLEKRLPHSSIRLLTIPPEGLIHASVVARTYKNEEFLLIERGGSVKRKSHRKLWRTQTVTYQV